MTSSGGVPVSGIGAIKQGDGSPRHATWLELFFDLVFVVAIAELTHGFVGHPDADHALRFVLLFVPTYLVWLNVSYYADLFDTDDLRSRGVLVVAMLGALVLATGLEPALEGRVTVFVGAYLALRCLLLALYLRVAFTEPEIRGFAGRFAAGYALGAFLWGVSLGVTTPTQYVVWAVAVCIEAATPAVAYTTAVSPSQESHMPERFGLFTIVVLGETIVAVAAGLTETVWTLQTITVALLAFGLAVVLWWLYFDSVDESVITRSVRAGRRAVFRGLGYSYGHYVITFGVAMTGVGSALVFEELGTAEPNASVGYVILVGGVACYLFGTGLAFGVTGLIPRGAIAARCGVAVALMGWVLVAPMHSWELAVGVVVVALVSLTAGERFYRDLNATIPFGGVD